ncbi:MAG: class I SAM-dependent methyltransferase [Planctomycetes bacterium]|nr:class I SAM-dependent methyltransferase [Planctomycetota bacterium]
MKLAESILLRLSRPVGGGDYHNEAWKPDDPLNLLKRQIPQFAERIRGAAVLDFGCYTGHQSVALLDAGASRVVGIDINETAIAAARDLARERQLQDRVRFVTTNAELADEQFDFVVSQNAMEHFDDPAAILSTMTTALKPGGRILASFGPPWLAPYGSHMYFFCRLPWMHLLFSERTVMRVRSRFRDGDLKTYREAGLNRLTIGRFERLVARQGLEVEYRKYDCVKNLTLIGRIPLVRELFINHVTCILRRPGGTEPQR